MRPLLLSVVAVVVGGSVGLGLAIAAPGSREAPWVAVRLPGSNPQANAINDKGWVVGTSGANGNYHAALWVDGKLRDLGTLGGTLSMANDVNDRGQVVGWSLTKGENWQSQHVFLWEKGKMRDLGTLPGGTEPDAEAINENGPYRRGILHLREPPRLALATGKDARPWAR